MFNKMFFTTWIQESKVSQLTNEHASQLIIIPHSQTINRYNQQFERLYSCWHIHIAIMLFSGFSSSIQTHEKTMKAYSEFALLFVQSLSNTIS